MVEDDDENDDGTGVDEDSLMAELNRPAARKDATPSAAAEHDEIAELLADEPLSAEDNALLAQLQRDDVRNAKASAAAASASAMAAAGAAPKRAAAPRSSAVAAPNAAAAQSARAPATAARSTTVQQRAVAAATSSPAPAHPPPVSHLTAKQLGDIMRAQIAQTNEAAKQAKASGDKQKAVLLYRQQKQMMSEMEIIAAAARTGAPPPPHRIVTTSTRHETTLPHLNLDEMEGACGCSLAPVVRLLPEFLCLLSA